MSTLSEQLREALAGIHKCEWTVDGKSGPHFDTVLRKLPALLDEHERLERESEAGKNLLTHLEVAMGKEDSGQYSLINRVIDAIAIYRSACEGEK